MFQSDVQIFKNRSEWTDADSENNASDGSLSTPFDTESSLSAPVAEASALAIPANDPMSEACCPQPVHFLKFHVVNYDVSKRQCVLKFEKLCGCKDM